MIKKIEDSRTGILLNHRTTLLREYSNFVTVSDVIVNVCDVLGSVNNSYNFVRREQTCVARNLSSDRAV